MKKNKKILILHSSNDLYGASKIFLQISNLLVNNGVEIHVILPSKGPLDDLINSSIKVKYFELGVLRKKYLNPIGLINRMIANLKAIKFLSSYIKNNGINLVYTNTSTILSGGLAASKNKVPSLFHIHEIPEGNRLYEFFSGYMVNRNSDKIIAVSESVKNHWLKYSSFEKIKRIYNGIIFNKTKILDEFKKNENDFIITNIARIIPYKGHDYLIDIAAELFKKNKNFKFLIIGDTLSSYASYELNLKKRVKDLGLSDQIQFFGYRKDISNVLQQSDLFIHTAISPDPLPTVLFESLYNELPSVSTNLGGAIEILDNGNNGLLIPYNDSIKASSLIIEYIKNKELQKIHLKNSKTHFKGNFNSSVFEQNILNEVISLL